MGIRYIEKGDLFTSGAQVLVCPTNAAGVMGNGLARYFRNRVPGLFGAYQRHCSRHRPSQMVPFVFPTDDFIVYCLHTKRKWWEDSSTTIVRNGLLKFIAWCEQEQIDSVALPALGCGKGGLDFYRDVKPIMHELLKESNMSITVYCS
jgi:O-acetyl-ADP-ribose deacetylase (regulator of RNase III)